MSNESIETILAGYKRTDADVSVLADALGVAYSSLQRQLNPNDAYQFPVTKIIPLVTVTGDFSLIDHIEKRLGRMAMPLPRKDRPLDMSVYASFVKESGDALTVVSGAMADWKITNEEARQIRKEVIELVSAATSILANLPD